MFLIIGRELDEKTKSSFKVHFQTIAWVGDWMQPAAHMEFSEVRWGGPKPNSSKSVIPGTQFILNCIRLSRKQPSQGPPWFISQDQPFLLLTFFCCCKPRQDWGGLNPAWPKNFQLDVTNPHRSKLQRVKSAMSHHSDGFDSLATKLRMWNAWFDPLPMHIFVFLICHIPAQTLCWTHSSKTR